MKIRMGYICPLKFVHDTIKGKWKAIFLWQGHAVGNDNACHCFGRQG